MAESSIPVDLLNPGQVFACLGILEAAEVLLGNSRAAFDWSGTRGTVFSVVAGGEEPPVGRVLRFLADAEVVARAPHGSQSLEKWRREWGVSEFDPAGHPFPFPDPGKHDVLPAVLRGPTGEAVAVEYWGDSTRRDNVKFWGGMGGKPGAALLGEALGLVRDRMQETVLDPFALNAPQSSSFRFDWRRDNIPVQDGFSVNEHSSIRMVGFPVVEILASVGLTHARPMRSALSKFEYRYGVVGSNGDGPALLEPVFHRAALGLDRTPVPGLPFRRFAMHLELPAQGGHDRSIAYVNEEDIAE